jgi:hypothetical protein
MTPLYHAGGGADLHSWNAAMRSSSVIRDAPNNRMNQFIAMKSSWTLRDRLIDPVKD